MAILLLPASNLGMIILGADEKEIKLSDILTKSGDKSDLPECVLCEWLGGIEVDVFRNFMLWADFSHKKWQSNR